jgi:hypothetical protein
VSTPFPPRSDPCAGCDYADLCKAGYLCPMIRPDLSRDDTEYAQEARDLAEAMAVAT